MPPVLHMHISVIYHWHHLILATASVIEWPPPPSRPSFSNCYLPHILSKDRNHEHPTFLCQRTTSILVGWFTGCTCKNNSRWYTELPKLLCNFYSMYLSYKCGHWRCVRAPWPKQCLLPRPPRMMTKQQQANIISITEAEDQVLTFSERLSHKSTY